MGSKTIAFLGLFLAIVLLITSEVTARDLAETTTSTASSEFIYSNRIDFNYTLIKLKLLNRPLGLMMPSIMVVAVDTEVVVDTGMEVADAVDMEVADAVDTVDMEGADAVDTVDMEVAHGVDMEAAVTKKGINIMLYIGANI
ncbi:hypothetical protein RHGRI_018009 [Rhododendron griersonianum]|uniref:Transmembrane protein n=1 Tax=Rhododendron griersonianum TaxID=479676 RepID=A0AAV6JZY6_9ERIC|nr:hypothetical protein RHGRI_018009 [Rhododendron griersonianum]